MRAAVLFSGLGGWEIAAALNGVETIWAAEWDDWKRARYLERWPSATLYGDVEKLDGRRLVRERGAIDLLLASPPCTDISAANVNGAGVDGEESRYYFEAIRLAREIGTRWVGFENSPRLRTRGADRVLAELEASGYTPWANVVEAEDAGAPHERGRSFVLGCRSDVIEGSHAERARLWQQQGWSGWPDRAGAAKPQENVDSDIDGQLDGAEHAEMGRSARVDGAAGQRGREATDMHGQKLSSAERAALCPWDRRGDGLAGYLFLADGVASRLRGHGLSERAVKAELARWRSALGDALVIPVVWAAVRSIVRTDAELMRELPHADVEKITTKA